jgi:hypothetical protein
VTVPCACVTCDVDREKGRPQYVVLWKSSLPTRVYFTYASLNYGVYGLQRALRVGPRHPFGDHLVRVRLKQKTQMRGGRHAR